MVREEIKMHSLTRRSFVKSVGLGAGLVSMPPVAEALSPGHEPDVALPQTPPKQGVPWVKGHQMVVFEL